MEKAEKTASENEPSQKPVVVNEQQALKTELGNPLFVPIPEVYPPQFTKKERQLQLLAKELVEVPKPLYTKAEIRNMGMIRRFFVKHDMPAWLMFGVVVYMHYYIYQEVTSEEYITSMKNQDQIPVYDDIQRVKKIFSTGYDHTKQFLGLGK